MHITFPNQISAKQVGIAYFSAATFALFALFAWFIPGMISTLVRQHHDVTEVPFLFVFGMGIASLIGCLIASLLSFQLNQRFNWVTAGSK